MIKTKVIQEESMSYCELERRIIFDITDLLRLSKLRLVGSGKLSGIPRCAFTLARHALTLQRDRIHIGYFDEIKNEYYRLRLRDDHDTIEKVVSILRQEAHYARPFKPWKYKQNSIKKVYHGCMRYALLRILRAAHCMVGNNGTSSDKNGVTERMKLTDRDIIVCLGGGWDALELFKYLERKKLISETNSNVVVVLHDMIPVLPDVVANMAAAQFEFWLHQMMRIKAKMLIAADSTISDFRKWCQINHYSCPQVEKFPFGDELVRICLGPIRKEISDLDKTRYVLMVGTITNRKNGGNLIRAWQTILQRYSDAPALVIAGAQGRSSLASCGINDPNILSDRLIFIENANDNELAHLYQNCMFTVYPSLYEGWGLPIGESLWYGKICVTSNRSSMPEVGRRYCEYFCPDEPEDMANVIGRLVGEEGYLRRRCDEIKQSHLITWKDSAKLMLAALDRLLDDEPVAAVSSAAAPPKSSLAVAKS